MQFIVRTQGTLENLDCLKAGFQHEISFNRAHDFSKHQYEGDLKITQKIMFSVYTADVFWSVTKSFKDIEEIECGTAETLAKAVNACEQNATIMLFNIKPEDFMDSVNDEFEDHQPISVYSHLAISVMACTIAVIPSVIFGFVIGQTLG